jgi:hypothetical protein
MLNVLNEGTSERTRKTSIQENSKLTWKTTENGGDDKSENEGVRSRVK